MGISSSLLDLCCLAVWIGDDMGSSAIDTGSYLGTKAPNPQSIVRPEKC
jgi:hypothetical protein